MVNEKDWSSWIPVSQYPPDGLIRTLHMDGKEDICRVLRGVIYSYDTATDAPITHYKLMYEIVETKNHLGGI